MDGLLNDAPAFALIAAVADDIRILARRADAARRSSTMRRR
jgi:hypothetical protein